MGHVLARGFSHRGRPAASNSLHKLRCETGEPASIQKVGEVWLMAFSASIHTYARPTSNTKRHFSFFLV